MTTIAWIATTGGDWSVGANWQGGIVPGATDDAIMSLSSNETITLSTSESVHSVLFDDPAATYLVTSTGTLTSATSLELDGLAITMNGSLDAGTGVTLGMTGDIALGGVITAQSVSLSTTSALFLPGGTIGVGGVSIPMGTPVLIASIFTTELLLPSFATISLECFVTGTNIATPGGDRAVETLLPGDHVSLSDGGHAPIVWVGRRLVDCRRHPDPAAMHPVRVRRGAFANGMPERDLLLSPDHAVCVRDTLIPVRLLINGRSIAREARDLVEYFHLELPAHDIILAEGLPVESYLDTGGRSAFDNAGSVTDLHPRFAPAIREAYGCRPLVVTGATIDDIRRDLACRSDEMATAPPPKIMASNH